MSDLAAANRAPLPEDSPLCGRRQRHLSDQLSHAHWRGGPAQAGRDTARNRGLEVTGTIGVLRAAVKKGHVDAAHAARALQDTTVRASPDLYRVLNQQG